MGNTHAHAATHTDGAVATSGGGNTNKRNGAPGEVERHWLLPVTPLAMTPMRGSTRSALDMGKRQVSLALYQYHHQIQSFLSQPSCTYYHNQNWKYIHVEIHMSNTLHRSNFKRLRLFAGGTRASVT